MNDILIRNSSSLGPYLPYIRPQFPLSTNTRKTLLKPIVDQPSLSSLPKKTDNFKRQNDVNNLKKTLRKITFWGFRGVQVGPKFAS